MSGTWERVFEVAVPVERAWEALTDRALRAEMATPPEWDADAIALAADQEDVGHIRGLEIDPPHRLRWADESPSLPERAEFTVVLESIPTGTRMTVTRYGFGEGEQADIFGEANGLGMLHGFMDLITYLETGQIVKRQYDGNGRSGTGIMYAESSAGLVVHRVEPGTFGSEAGLERGDLLIRLAGCAVYERSDLWAILRLLPAHTQTEVEFVRKGEVCTSVATLSPISVRAVGE